MNTLVNHHPGAAILCSFSHRGFFVSHGAIGVPKKRAYIFLSHTSTPIPASKVASTIFYDMMYHDVFFFAFTIPTPHPTKKPSFSSNSK